MGVFKHKDHEKSLLRVKQNRRRGKLRKGFNEKTAYCVTAFCCCDFQACIELKVSNIGPLSSNKRGLLRSSMWNDASDLRRRRYLCEAHMLCVLIGIDLAKVRGTMQRSYFSLIQLVLLPSSDIMS